MPEKQLSPILGGCRVWDVNGKQYLDALGGIAVGQQLGQRFLAGNVVVWTRASPSR